MNKKKCDAGYYCMGGAIKPAPTDGTTGRMCAKGHYCESGELEKECPSGSYEPREGSSKCQACYKGYICP